MKFLKSPRERILAALFALATVGVVLAIGGGQLVARQAFLENEIFRLRSESFELRSWIAERDLIRARQQWIEQHLPRSNDIRKNGVEFLDAIQKQAQLAGAKLGDKSILEPEITESWTSIPVRVSLQCEFPRLVRLLHEVQQPGEFVMMRDLVVKTGSDRREVAATLEFLKIFRPLSP